MFAVSGELRESFFAARPGHSTIPAHVGPGQRVRLLAHAVRNEFAVGALPVEQRDGVFVGFDLDQPFGQHFQHDVAVMGIAIRVCDPDRQRSPALSTRCAAKSGLRSGGILPPIGFVTEARSRRYGFQFDACGQFPFDDLPLKRCRQMSRLQLRAIRNSRKRRG
jgi:hypothetical protein